MREKLHKTLSAKAEWKFVFKKILKFLPSIRWTRKATVREKERERERVANRWNCNPVNEDKLNLLSLVLSQLIQMVKIL